MSGNERKGEVAALLFMNTSTRRKIGGSLALLAVALFPALAFAGVPLISRSSAYFLDTGTTKTSVHLHWPLAAVAALFVIGVALVLFPRRDNVASTKAA